MLHAAMPHESYTPAWRRGVVLLALSFIFPASVFSASADQTEVIFDLVPQFAPASEEKTVPFFRSQRFEAGSGCTLTYSRSGSGVQASWQVLEDAATTRSLFNKLPVQVVTWWADPALCSRDTKVTTGPDSVEVAVPGPQQTAQSVTFTQDRISLRQRSIEAFTKRFGSPFFRSENRLDVGNRTHLYTTVRFGRLVFLSEYQSLKLVIDAKLVNAEITTGCVPGIPPRGAQNCYEARRVATQFRAATGNIIWSDPRCKENNPADPICRYQGRFMQTSISLFDERIPFHNDDFHVQRGNSREAHAQVPIYRINLKHLLPAGTVANPFHTVGRRAVAQGDILPLLKKGLLQGAQLGRLPPRLSKADGTKETDDEYFAHYSIGSMNFGYEVTGLSDMTFDIYRLSLTAAK
jgi:hypothetical protein